MPFLHLRSSTKALLGALCLTFTSVCLASETPVTLTGTVEWQMNSERGQPYRILISLPEGDVPYTGGYPVLYVLDANAYFASFHEAKRAQRAYRHAIVVGLAYPGEEPLNFLRRAWDFSPPVPEERNTPPQGGQDELINFLADKLMPAIAERFPVDADQQSLFGHSFGGMFAIHTLYQRPELFNHLVAASPSIWWNDRFLLVEERAFVEQANSGDLNLTHTSLALMLGERDSPQEIQDSQALQQRLAPLSSHGLRTSFYVEPGEDHMSVPFKLVNRVLREVLTARQR